MGRRGMGRGPIAILVASLLVLGLLTAGVSRDSPDSRVVDAAGSTSVAVTAEDTLLFDPNAFNDVGTNTTITVSFTDGGSLAHTWSLSSREGVVINTALTPAELSAYFTTYPPLVSIQQNGSGTAPPATFTSPGVGWYEFVCLEPGHFQAGMYGFIAFGEALPANLTVTAPYDGAGAAVFIIVGTIVSLTVVAIVLGFVVGRRRGSSDEMPPERLGYPEPPLATASPKLTDASSPPKT